MKGILLKTVVAGVVTLLCSPLCSADEARQYHLNVGEFSILDVEDSFNVDYRSDNEKAGTAEFTTTKEIADKIIFENNKKGKLTIQKAFYEGDEMKVDLPQVTVYSKFVKEIRNCGDSTVRALSVRPTIELKAAVVGNGRLVIRGVDCSKFDGAIKTGNGTLVVDGTGTTGCWPVDELKVKGVMAGKLYYRNEPKSIRNYSMGVKIYSLEGKEWIGEEKTDNQ